MKANNESIYYSFVETPAGVMKIEATYRTIRSLTFVEDMGASHPNALCEKAAAALHDYFSGKGRSFDLPLEKAASPFAEKVYEATKNIPFGEVRSYGAIARAVGAPGAARAVGRALSKNPYIIVVPCHRVVYASGEAGHYAGGDEKKRALLAFERGVS